MKIKLIMFVYFNRICVGIFGMNLNKLCFLDLNILLQYSYRRNMKQNIYMYVENEFINKRLIVFSGR